MLILRGVARVVLDAAREAEAEVGRVVGHGLLAGDVHLHVAEAEVLRRSDEVGYRGQRVALQVGGQRLEHVVEVEVGVEGAIERRGPLLLERVVEREVELELLGEEAAEVEAGGHGILVVVVEAALAHTLLKATEACRLGMAAHVDATGIGELHVEGTLRCPATLVVEAREAQLVEPYLDVLGRARVVAHTDHHGLDLAHGGVTDDADAVLGVVLIELRVDAGLRYLGIGIALDVALALELGELGKVDVEHVVLGPHGLAAAGGVAVVVALWGDGEGDLVLVVVALVVGAEAHEDGHLAILDLGGGLHEVLGVDIHLHVLVLAQVEVGLVVHGTRLIGFEAGNLQTHGLLVVLTELGLRGVEHTRDAGRHSVVDGLAVAILLDVDRGHHHVAAHLGSLVEGRVDGLVVAAPSAADKLHGGEAHDDGLAEAGHVDTHEAQRGEVADAAHDLLVVVDGHAELIPVDALGVAVAQLGAVGAHVGDMVAAHHHVLWAQRHAVLEVLLILVERVVLVDVLHVGRGLGALVVVVGAGLRRG